MNIQIYARSKCFDSKKAERWFKERRIKYQLIDLDRIGLSPRELESVVSAVGLENIVDEKTKSPDAAAMKYLSSREQKLEKLLDDPRLLKSPIVRNGRQATVGYRPEVWEEWK